MSLRSFRFYLSGYLHYYEHLRLPRQQLDVYCPVRVSHVHVLPSTHTQQNITPSSPAGFAVCRILFLFSTLSSMVSGFIIYGRLTTAFCVTKPDFCSLCVRELRALMYLVSTYIIATASTRTTNLIDCNFHTIRYLLLILHTPRGAP